MPEYTVGRDSDWSRLATTVSSTRHTTTSSRPGAVITGTVQRQRGVGLVTCPKCGRKRYDFETEHSPHFNAVMQLINCIGEVLREAVNAVD